MEILVVICLVFFILIVALLVFNKTLRSEKKELKTELKKREALIKKELLALESYGQYYVDCDAYPLEIKGFTVISHKQIGLWKFNPDTSFYLSEKQNKDNGAHGTIKGCELYQELVDKNVLNGNALDFLLEHPLLIPKDWNFPMPFWGTIYRNNQNGQCYVRCLICYLGGEYGYVMHWLGAYLVAGEAAILAE